LYSRVFLCRAIVRVCLRGRRRFSRRSTALFACVFACVCMRVCAYVCACVSSCKMRACVRVSVHACGVLFVSMKKHSRACGRLYMSVCARVRARACVGGPTSVVMLFRSPSRSHRACVCLCCRARIAWALVGAPIESMLTAAGDAWADFVLVEGNGHVFVFVAPEGLDRAASAVLTAGNGTVVCWMYYGGVWVNGARVRGSTPDWGVPMAPGESVRVRYVAATRMFSIVWRGRSYDLAALSATANIAHMRFGVALGRDHSMRVTGASAGASCAQAGCVARPCVLDSRCSWLFRSSQRTSSSNTCDLSCAPA
jgi:hypothetical protein